MTENTVEQAAKDRSRDIEITVNNRPVHVQDKQITGLEIKQAAVEQGVPIQLDFLLSEHLNLDPWTRLLDGVGQRWAVAGGSRAA